MHPIDCLRSRKRVLARLGAYFFAYRVPPDVGGNLFNNIRGAKNVVVVTRLPKVLVVGFAKVKGRALFQQTDKFAKVGAVVDSFSEDVKVVRHDAVCVEAERMTRCTFKKKIKDAARAICLSEMRSASIAAKGDKVGLAAEVVFGS